MRGRVRQVAEQVAPGELSGDRDLLIEIPRRDAARACGSTAPSGGWRRRDRARDDGRHLSGPRPGAFGIDLEGPFAGRSRPAADRRRSSARDPRTRRAPRPVRRAALPLNTTRTEPPSSVDTQVALVASVERADDDDRTQVVEARDAPAAPRYSSRARAAAARTAGGRA